MPGVVAAGVVDAASQTLSNDSDIERSRPYVLQTVLTFDLQRVICPNLCTRQMSLYGCQQSRKHQSMYNVVVTYSKGTWDNQEKKSRKVGDIVKFSVQKRKSVCHKEKQKKTPKRE